MLSTLSFNNKFHFLFRFQDDGRIESFDVLRCFKFAVSKIIQSVLLDKISPKIVWNKYQCLNGCTDKAPLLQDTLKQHHMNLTFAMVYNNNNNLFSLSYRNLSVFRCHI